MGQEVELEQNFHHFHKKDYKRFQKALEAETAQIAEWAKAEARGRKQREKQEQDGNDNNNDGSNPSTTSNRQHTIGMEVEVWLVDRDTMLPACISDPLIESLGNDPSITHELGQFQLEYNSDVHELTGSVFKDIHAELHQFYMKVNEAASSQFNGQVLCVGTLPTLTPQDLSPDTMSNCLRYKALNQEILHWRRGAPYHLEITDTPANTNASTDVSSHSSESPDSSESEEPSSSHDSTTASTADDASVYNHSPSRRILLEHDHDNVMLEAACCSFQLHWQTADASKSAAYYNASLMATPALMAACGNSPILFGRSNLWHETRIPTFEQAVYEPRSGPTPRGWFPNYCSSLVDLFADNLKYKPLLPINFPTSIEQCRHMLLHNGMLWRWLRPILGVDTDNENDDHKCPPQYHLRMEHRSLPSGPTVVDMIANAAFYYGLVEYILTTTSSSNEKTGDSGNSNAGSSPDGPRLLPIDVVRSNFYRASQYGLNAQLQWPTINTNESTRKSSEEESIDTPTTITMMARELILTKLLPMALIGLQHLNIDAHDSNYYLNDVFKNRVLSGQTGSVWQLSWLHKHRRDRSVECEGKEAEEEDWNTTSSLMAAMTKEYAKNQFSDMPVSDWTN